MCGKNRKKKKKKTQKKTQEGEREEVPSLRCQNGQEGGAQNPEGLRFGRVGPAKLMAPKCGPPRVEGGWVDGEGEEG